MQFEKEELLAKVKELLRSEMTELTYDLWIKDLSYHSFTETEIVFGVTTSFIKELMDSKYLEIIR